MLLVGKNEETLRIIERWDPEPMRVDGPLGKAAHVNRALGVVVGWSLSELEVAERLNVDVPVYHPLVGMDEEEVERRLKEISE